jgi:hypothetical protein
MNQEPRVEQAGVDLEGPERANAAARARTLAALRTEGQRLRRRRTRRRVAGGAVALAVLASVGITVTVLSPESWRGGPAPRGTTAAGMPGRDEAAGTGPRSVPPTGPSRYAAVWNTATNPEQVGSTGDSRPDRITVVPMTTDQLLRQLEDDGHPIGVIETGGRVRLVRSRATAAE